MDVIKLSAAQCLHSDVTDQLLVHFFIYDFHLAGPIVIMIKNILLNPRIQQPWVTFLRHKEISAVREAQR